MPSCTTQTIENKRKRICRVKQSYLGHSWQVHEGEVENVPGKDLEVDRRPGDGLVLARHARCLGFNLLSDLLKVKELLVGEVEKLCAVWGLVQRAVRRGRRRRQGSAVGVNE